MADENNDPFKRFNDIFNKLSKYLNGGEDMTGEYQPESEPAPQAAVRWSKGKKRSFDLK